MKIKIIFLLHLVFLSSSFCQNYNQVIEGFINKTNLDSLVSYVRILSGEDSVIINDTLRLIEHRISMLDNNLTAEYLKHKMSSFGLETHDEKYSSEGRNIYAVQRGVLYPEKYFIYCAHYDAVCGYAADDNASGVANVIEAARILSPHQMNYSVIYAFWDEEEFGKMGSEYFVAMADSNKMQIEGVLNSEMAGWDGGNDGLMDIHTRPFGKSFSLADCVYTIDSIYNLPLKPVIYNPGTYKSDHSSFWAKNISAIEFCEAYYGRDYNPYYHSLDDRIDKFNREFFHNMTKLGVGAISTFALDNPLVGIENEENAQSKNVYLLDNYPNPFNPTTMIQYSVVNTGNVSLKVYDVLGNEVATLVNEEKQTGSYEVEFQSAVSNQQLASGIYFYQLRAGEFVQTKKMILLR